LGFSTTITHAILVVAALTAASILSTAIIIKFNFITSTISQVVQSQANSLLTDITIIDVFYNSTGGYFIIYAKNTGNLEIARDSISKTDVYLGRYGDALDLYIYNASGGPGYWNYSKADPSSTSWLVGETITIKVYNRTTVQSPYHVKICLPSAVVEEFVGG